MVASKYNVDEHGIGLQGYSPVSYVDLGIAEEGVPEFSAEHHGVTYRFTDAEQLATFVANPAKYEPAFGGWCAFGLTIDKQFSCDPQSFKVVDGRLMTFLRDGDVDAKALWEEGEEQEMIDKAQSAWAKLTD